MEEFKYMEKLCKVLFEEECIEVDSILNILYRSYKGFENNKDYENSVLNFNKAIDNCVHDEMEAYVLHKFALETNILISKDYFKAGFNYAIKLVKECNFLNIGEDEKK